MDAKYYVFVLRTKKLARLLLNLYGSFLELGSSYLSSIHLLLGDDGRHLYGIASDVDAVSLENSETICPKDCIQLGLGRKLGIGSDAAERFLSNAGTSVPRDTSTASKFGILDEKSTAVTPEGMSSTRSGN